MDLIKIAVIGCICATGWFWLAAYIYGKELGREKLKNEELHKFCEKLRTRLESIQYSQRVKK